jgi:hypothetical protein
MMIIDPASATIDQLVRLQTNFIASIDLERAYDPAYRTKCSDTYIYLSEDKAFFTGLVNALTNLLPGGLHTVLETGPYGAGKSLLDVVRGDLFATPNNKAILDKLPNSFWKEQIEDLIHDAPALVTYIGGIRPQTQSNLDNAFIEALEKALPPGIQLHSQFDRARTWILSTYPGGKKSFLRTHFEQHLKQQANNDDPWTVGQIEEGLQRRMPEALDVFRRALDATTSWPGANFGPTTSTEVYEEIRTTLVGTQRQFSNMILFFDEFSQWASTASPQDISTLQSFVEWVNHSSHVAMVISSQVRPQRQGKGHNELETLISRTHPVAFNRSSYARLLRGAIRRVISPYPPIDSRPDWPKLAALHHECFPDDSEPVKTVHSYYPFHPAAVKALPALVDQLGYRERSIALYLSMGKDVPGFGQFIHGPLFEDDRGNLRLITFDRLFPYFEARLRDDNPPLYARYEQAKNIALDELGRRLVMTLALCDVLEARAPLITTEENIVRLLNLPQEDADSLVAVQQALQNLADNGLILKDGRECYKLSAPGGLSLTIVNRAITQRKQAIISSGVPVEARQAIPFINDAVKIALDLRKYHYSSPKDKELPFSKSTTVNPQQVKAIEYQKRFKVERTFTIELISRQQLLELKNKVALRQKQAEYEKILVVIATDTDSQQEDIENLRQAAHTLAQAGTTVGLPKSPLILSDVIREVSAAQQIGQDEPYRHTELLERALRTRFSQMLSQFIKEVRVETFLWYTPDLTTSDQAISASSLAEVADRAALYLGDSFPFGITLDNLIGKNSSSQVITALLQCRGISLTRGNQPPQKDRIIRGALVPIGLINEIKEGVASPTDSAEVIEPDPTNHKDTRVIWDLLDTTLGKGADSTTIAQVIQTISRQPYWLPKDLGIYFLAALVGFRELHIYKAGQAEQRTKDTLAELWKDPTDYVLKLPPRTNLSPEAQLLLSDLQVVIKATVPQQSELKEIELKNASFISEDQLEALITNINTWDTAIGKKARDLNNRLGLSFPSPLNEWLTFLTELETGELDRTQGVTYTSLLAQKIIDDSTSPQVYSGLLDSQIRQLQKLVGAANMLDRASTAVQKANAPEELISAWASFCADPLNETLRSGLQAALTVANLKDAEKPHKERQTTLVRDREKATQQNILFSDPPQEVQRNRDEAKVSNQSVDKSPKPEDEIKHEQADGWQIKVNRIAKTPISTDALLRCINLMQRLIAQIEEHGTNPNGDLVLDQIVSALKPSED